MVGICKNWRVYHGFDGETPLYPCFNAYQAKWIAAMEKNRHRPKLTGSGQLNVYEGHSKGHYGPSCEDCRFKVCWHCHPKIKSMPPCNPVLPGDEAIIDNGTVYLVTHVILSTSYISPANCSVFGHQISPKPSSARKLLSYNTKVHKPRDPYDPYNEPN